MLIAVHGLTGTRSQVVRQYRRLATSSPASSTRRRCPETDATYRAALARTIARSRAARRGASSRRWQNLVVVG